MAKILILTDGKAGHENQSKAFARALGGEFELVKVQFKSKFHKALSYLYDNIGILTTSLFSPMQAPSDDIRAVIGTGSGTFYAVKVLAKKLGVKGAVVLYPRGYKISNFDCILAPVFDQPAPAKNVIAIPANLVANDEAFYDKAVGEFKQRIGDKRHDGKESDIIAVIIGGPNKCSTMSEEWIRNELDRIMAENPNAVKWVTTSRRTPAEVEKAVSEYKWDYELLYSKDHFNPIPAFVKLASKIYVTAESTGMISEACTFGSAEVYALDNLMPGNHKFRRFVVSLGENGYINGNRKIDLADEFSRARRLMEV